MYEKMVLFLLLLLVVLLLYTFHKVRKIHLMQYYLMNQNKTFPNQLNVIYQQIQAFITLERRLSLPYSLPPLRGWAASPDFLLLIADHVAQHKPETIVECSSGASTLVMAQTVKKNGKGHIYSLEHDSFYAEKTREHLRRQGLEDWATVIDAPLQLYTLSNQQYQWYKLEGVFETNQIDMLVIDGPPQDLNKHARYPAGEILFPLLTNQAAVFLDDSDRTDEREIIEMWLLRFKKFQLLKHSCEKGAVSLVNNIN